MSRGDLRPLVVVGDALLDRDVDGTVERLCPDAPAPVLDESATSSRPGGAGLAAVLAAAEGREVTLITAISDDAPGRELRRALAGAHVELVDLGLDGATPEKVRVRTGGRSLVRIDRGGPPGGVGPVTAAARAAVGWAGAVLVSDYGRGVAAEPGMRGALAPLTDRMPVVWDPHPRGASPLAGCLLATPNEAELARFAGRESGEGTAGIAAAAEAIRARWRAGNLCVTRGAGGALLVSALGKARAVPAPASEGGDACGAGDRFAVGAAAALADGASVEEAVTAAVAAASRFVSAGGAAGAVGAGADRRNERIREGDASALALSVRARGGTVVATGGCFDLLHPGHVRTLEAARALGDCLILCLNSDASVRRLKGPDRPLVRQEDRAAVLEALACVDRVVVFDEDTPERVLDELRPDVWVKGGDYAARELPEARVLSRWGGRIVVLPYLEGRSTTQLIRDVTVRAAG